MPENNNNDQPLDFAEKVLQSLKRQSRAVDLNEIKASSTKDFTALGAQEAGGGPGTGGNKDIVIIPGYGGVAATSVSQVNFYWNAPATPDSTGIDSNVRATLYNFAISATRPTLVIGGYDGTNQYKPQSDYGTGTGITAKIWFHPFIGRVDADQFGFNTIASTGVSTLLGVLTWDTTQNKIRVGQGGGTAKTLAYTDDISPFSGSATTASNLNLANTAAATNHFLTMSASQTATGVAGAAISTVSTVFVVPNTGVLNATGFSGNVTGTVSGNVTGNVSGSVTGNVSGNLTGNVSGNVTGNVSGNVTGNVSGNLTGNVVGNAGTAYASQQVLTSASGDHFVTFSPTSTSSSGSGVSIVSTFKVVPSTGVVTASGFSGNVTGTVSGNVTGNVSGSVTGNLSGNVTGNVSGSVTGNVSGNLTGNVSGNVTGNVSGNLTGNVVGFAGTAYSVQQVLTSASGDHFVTFSPTSTNSSGSGVSIVSTLKIVPSTGILTASGFSGNVTGTVSGNVTGNVSGSVTGNLSGNVTGNVSGTVTGNLSGNVTGNVSGSVTGNVSGNVTGNVSGNLTGNVVGNAGTAYASQQVLTSASGDHFVTFSPTSTSSSGSGVSIVSTLKIVPSTGILTASGFSGNVTGTVSGNVTGNVSGTVTGNVSGNVTGNVSGSVTGNVSGNLTGNVSGNVTGNVSGNLTGNVVGTATTAQNVNVLASDTATGNHFLPFVRTQTGSGLALSTDSALYYDPAGNTLYSTNFSGAFSGTISGIASTASNLVVNDATTSSNHFILFSPSATGAGVAVSSDSTVTINPNTNAMSLGTGNLTANSVTVGSSARTVSTSTGNLILDSSGGQVDITDNVVITGNLTVQGSTITVDSTVSTIVDPVIVVGSGVGGSHSTADNNQDRGIEFRWATGGTATTGFFGFSDTDGKFRFIPNATTVAGSNVYTGTVGTVVANLEGAHSGNVTGNVSGNVTGNVSGNVTGNVSGNLTGNVVGNAGTSYAVQQVLTSASGDHFVTFSPTSTSSSGSGVSIVSSLKIVPSTGILTASGFSGNVTGTVSGNVTGNVSGSVTGNVSGSVTGNLSGNVTGNVSGNVTGNVSGNLTGNVVGFAGTAYAVQQMLTSASGDHFVTFSPTSTSSSGSGVSIVSTLKIVPSTGILTASGFSGNVTGTVSGNVTGNVSGNVTGNVSGTVTGNLSGNVTGNVSGSVTGNLSGNVTGNVSGNVTGNVSGNLTGNVVGFAGTAYATQQVLTSASGDHFVTFSPTSTSSSGSGVSIVSTLKIVPSTGILTASGFSGNVTGTVSGNVTGNVSGSVTGNLSGNVTGNVSGSVTGNLSGNVTGNVSGNVTGNVSGNLTGNVVGFAGTAYAVQQVLTSASGDHFITFSPTSTSSSGSGVSIVSSLKVVPSTGILTASGFSGNVTGTVSGNVTGNVSGSVTGNVSGNLTGNVSGNVTGNVSGSVTGNVSGNVTGNVSGNLTGNVSGFATTSSGTTLLNATSSTDHFPILAFSATGVGVGLSSDADFKYNPSTNTLTAGLFAGTAQSVQSVIVNNAASSSDHFLLFSPSSSGSGIAVSADTALKYVPSTDTLTVTNISPINVSSTSALSSGTYLKITTNVTDDNSTTDFFIRGLNSDGTTSKFSVDANGNLRATTKSFDIPHPTKEGKRLVYGVLEGPEHGVYHRGTVEGKGKLLVELPEYWTSLVNEDYSIQLTAWGNYAVHIVEKSPTSFIISANGNPFTQKYKNIKVDYIVHGSRKDAHLDIEQD